MIFVGFIKLFPQADVARKRIDEFLGEIFDFPDLGSLREALARDLASLQNPKRV